MNFGWINKKNFKRIRPLLGLLIMLGLIFLSSGLVFFSSIALLLFPLLWVIFSLCYHFKKENRKIKYLFNATRASMWVYFTTIFLLLIWTPHWVKILSIRLEMRTVINVFAPGNFMYGRICVAFLLSLTIFMGFLCHYKWVEYNERKEIKRSKDEK